MAPQLIYIMLTSLSLGVHLTKHGEKRDKKYNFWTSLISLSIAYFILYKGGFFNPLIK